MKTAPRVILITALLILSVSAVLPVAAGNSLASAVFQSGVPTPTFTLPPVATDTPVPPATDTPVPAATATPVPAATNTPAPAATNTPAPAATSTPAPAVTNTPIPVATSTPFPTYVPPTYPPPYPPYPPPSYTIIAYWTVQPGQTLYCIGRYYQVSPWAIASVNYIPWPYWIYPGQVLAIPNAPWYNIPPGPVCFPGVPNVTPPPPAPTLTPGPPPPTLTPGPPPPTPVPSACRYYHYVQWGQTLSGIAWYYGTTIQAIMYANPSITNPNLIYAGSTLCIP